MEADAQPLTIDSAGEIILVVGGTSAKVSLLVSSKVLTVVSPIFNAMLGPNFREGKELAESTPSAVFEMELSEDGPKAMKLLCLMAHSRSDSIPHMMIFSALEILVVLCDKYDCMQAIRFAAKSWIIPTDCIQNISVPLPCLPSSITLLMPGYSTKLPKNLP